MVSGEGGTFAAMVFPRPTTNVVGLVVMDGATALDVSFVYVKSVLPFAAGVTVFGAPYCRVNESAEYPADAVWLGALTDEQADINTDKQLIIIARILGTLFGYLILSIIADN